MLIIRVPAFKDGVKMTCSIIRKREKKRNGRIEEGGKRDRRKEEEEKKGRETEKEGKKEGRKRGRKRVSSLTKCHIRKKNNNFVKNHRFIKIPFSI